MEEYRQDPEPNPYDRASVFSKINSWWANGLVWKTYKKGLSLEDIPHAPEPLQAKNSATRFNTAVTVRLPPNQSRWKIMIFVYKMLLKFSPFAFFVSILISLILQICVVAQCFLVDGLMKSFLLGDKNDMYIYGGCICISTFLSGNLFCAKMQISIGISLQLHAAYCSAIINKVLAMTEYEMAAISSGNIKNLASVDVNIIRIAIGFMLFATDIIFAIIACGIASWWLIGWFTVFAISILIIHLLVQFKLSKVYSNLRTKSMAQTDSRIALVSDILKGIRIIKMNAWEKYFQNEVHNIRRKEYSYLGKTVTMRATIIAIYYLLARIELFVVLVPYYFLGDGFPLTQIFSLLGIFNILRISFGYSMPTLFEMTSQLLVSVSRIEDFLNTKTEDIQVDEQPMKPLKPLVTVIKSDAGIGNVTMTGVSCSWKDNLGCQIQVLKDITLAAQRGQLVGIVGPFGSGKTAILKAILGELPPTTGKISVQGRIAYVPQESWIYPSSFKQNITFGNPVDEDKIEQTIDTCALTKDVASFSQGIQQFVGENGICLSGGQKARLNLARAVYDDADIYLLDDPFSAVDARSARIIFKRCITEFMRNKTCILVTNHLQFLKDADNILVIKSGECIASGTYDVVQNFEDQLQIGKENKPTNESDIIEHAQYNYGSTDTLPANELSTEEVDSLLLQTQNMATDQVATGHVSRHVYWKFFTINLSRFIPILFILSAIALVCMSCTFDTQVKVWVNAETSWLKEVASQVINSSNGTNATVTESLIDHGETRLIYLIGLGTYLAAAAILSVVTLNIMGAMCKRGAQGINSALLQSVTRAQMKEFETQPIGNFINRFSLDTSRADTFVSYSAFDFVVDVCSATGFVIITILQNYWLAIPCVIVASLIGMFFIIVNKIIRDIQRLEGIASSPKYTHLNNTIAGASVTRAFNRQNIVINEFESHVDRHSSASFLNMTFLHWGYKAVFNTSCFYVLCVVFLLISTSDINNPDIGNIGIAMVSAFFLAEVMFAICFRFTTFECEMTCIERILNYTKLPSEPALDSSPEKMPPSDWPQKGFINFQDVSLSFVEDGKKALSNINFQLASQEKVGIVGRTGAGKTSIITALFRLHEPQGVITIDGVRTDEIGLHDLRNSISIIPQDPMLFCGTIRKNLDPVNAYTDDKLIQALDKVQMLNAIRTLPKGLESNVSEGGSNLSVGERQLLCIARAILRESRILVLDEATANVDDKTDEIIQKSIRDHFGECTVITIAHRLHTVMDADKIMVMEAGEIVEFGEPQVLLKNTEGHFYKLSQQSKHHISASLTKDLPQ